MTVSAATYVPLELCKLIEETVSNAVLLGLAGGRIDGDEYSILTLQRKFLYEYLEDRVIRIDDEPLATLRFR